MFGRDRLLNELRVEIARLSGVIDTLRDAAARLATTQETVKDHEVRLRRVERWMYAIPASLIVSAGAALVAWLGQMR